MPPDSTFARPADPVTPAERARWFSDEVHLHDVQLKAYLRGSFPLVRDVDDVVQESYLRIWKARARGPIRFTKAFLFTVARRVALDILRTGRSSPLTPVADLSELRVSEDGPGVAARVSLNEKIDCVVSALETLPLRRRQIVVLRKLQGLSQKDTAAKLGIAEKTVEEQYGRGIRRLAEVLRERGVEGYYER